MLPKSIKKRLPTRRDVQRRKYLQFLGDHLHSPNLWGFNRRSVARATAIGLFCAYLPIPFEMIPAAIAAILWRANLPIALAWVWISNPLTWIPLWAPAYFLGTKLLNQHSVPMADLTVEIITKQYATLWLGSILVGAIVGAAGYGTVTLIWRSRVISLWQQRREKRKKRREGTAAAQSKSTGH